VCADGGEAWRLGTDPHGGQRGRSQQYLGQDGRGGTCDAATDEVRRHYGLLVEDLEVAKCEQTSVLAEVEKRLWHGKSEREIVERRRQSSVTSSEEPRCNQARQSCRELRGCAGRVSVAHVREQKKA
jgi:hypothetical protein